MLLDYSSDIAPLQGRFFNPLGMRQSEFSQLQSDYMKNIAPMEDRMMQIASQTMAMQNQQLAFERGQLELENARRKAQMEMKSMEMTPNLLNQLNALKNDPTKTYAQKASELGVMQMGNAALINASPAVATMFNSASLALTADKDKAAKAEQDAQRKEARIGGVMSSAAQIGDVGTVKSLAGQDGVIDDVEGAYLGMATSYENRAKAKTLAEQQELQRQQMEKDLEANLGQMKMYESTLRNIGAIKAEQLPVAIANKGSSSISPIGNPDFKMEPQSRIQLERMMLELNPSLDQNFVTAVSDKDLYSGAISTVYKRINELTPKLKTSSRVTSAFD